MSRLELFTVKFRAEFRLFLPCPCVLIHREYRATQTRIRDTCDQTESRADYAPRVYALFSRREEATSTILSVIREAVNEITRIIYLFPHPYSSLSPFHFFIQELLTLEIAFTRHIPYRRFYVYMCLRTDRFLELLYKLRATNKRVEIRRLSDCVADDIIERQGKRASSISLALSSSYSLPSSLSSPSKVFATVGGAPVSALSKGNAV